MSDQMKCLVCENPATFSIRTKSLFNYNENAFYVEGIYCLIHYCEELMRIYNGLRMSQTPDYEAMSVRPAAVHIPEMITNDNGSTGTVQVMPEAENNELMLEVLSALPKPQLAIGIRDILPPEAELKEKEKEPKPKEELQIEKMNSRQMKQKTLEEKVKHAILEVGIVNSYEVAKYLHQPRGSVWHAIQRLGLQSKLSKKARVGRRKKYYSLPDNA